MESKQKKKNDTKVFILIYISEIDPHTQKINLWLPKGKGMREGQIRSLLLTYTHYCICITNKDLRNSTGNDTQYFEITVKGKESEKECKC